MTRIASRLAIALVLLAALAGAGRAADAVVVELYTSQGCSSCPPADALLRELAEREDVIALALHVDYWDYLGWQDRFASARFSDRQRNYGRAAGHHSIYTPQMIIGGSQHVIGNRPLEVAAGIDAARATDGGVDLTIRRRGNEVVVESVRRGGRAQPAVIQLVRYRPLSTIAIERGENAGRTIDYANIVTEWHQIGKWNGKDPLQLAVEVKGELPVVVIVQEPGPGRVLAAARLR